MNKEWFKKWNKNAIAWKKEKVNKISSLENIPLIQRKKYFKKLNKVNQIYLQFYVKANSYFSTQESIYFFTKKGHKLEAKEKEKDLEYIVDDLKEIFDDLKWSQDKIDFLTNNFEYANILNELKIDFSESFYLDIIDEGHKY